MAVRVSPVDTDMVSECNFILSAFDAEGDRVAGTLTGLTQPTRAENDEAPGYGSTLVGLRRNVEASLAHVVEAADKVAEQAQKFAKSNDGSGLAGLDALIKATPPHYSQQYKDKYQK